MVNITEEIIRRLDSLNYKIYDPILINNLSFLIKNNLEKVIGKDIFEESEVEIILSNGKLIITPSNANSFVVSSNNQNIIFKSDDFNLNIANIGSTTTSDLSYYQNNELINEKMDITENSLSISKKMNDQDIYKVKADYLGSIKTNTREYEFKQIFPSKNENFIERMKNFFRYYEDRDGEINYYLYNILKSKYIEVIEKNFKKIKAL